MLLGLCNLAMFKTFRGKLAQKSMDTQMEMNKFHCECNKDLFKYTKSKVSYKTERKQRK